MNGRAYVLASLLASLLLAPVGAAAADANETDQCISAAEEGQQLRDSGKYQLARDAFSRCQRETCPAMIRQDCGQWLTGIDNDAPTVIFGAKDEEGNDLTDVAVTVDMAPLVSTLDGRPVRVDPGEHVLRYETTGFAPVEEHVVIQEGEKARALAVRFGHRPPVARLRAAEPPDASPTAPAQGSVVRTDKSRPAAAAWVLAGVAAAAFGSEAYLGLTGLGQYNSDVSPHGCAPHCSESEKSSVQTKLVAGDVSLGVGLVSAGFAAYFFLAPHATRARSSVAVDFAPRPGGGVAMLRSPF